MTQQAFTCEICSASFVTEELLDAHRGQLHEAQFFVCPTCLARFETDNLLALHQQEEHRDIAPDALPCPECGLAYPTAAILEEHLAITHPHFPGMSRGG